MRAIASGERQQTARHAGPICAELASGTTISLRSAMNRIINAVTPLPRISHEDVAFAAKRVGSMSLEDKLAVMDGIHARQTNLLGSLLVLKKPGASLARMDTLANILLLCCVAMHRARPTWPVITEKLQDQQFARFVGAVEFWESLPRP